MSTKFTIKLVCFADPSRPACDLEGMYVKAYEPASMDHRGFYREDGDFAVTSSPADALQFDDAISAMNCWRMQKGERPDGRPNRPLTSYTVEIARIEVPS